MVEAEWYKLTDEDKKIMADAVYDEKLRGKLRSHGLEEVNGLPTPEEYFIKFQSEKRKRGRPKKGNEKERKVIDKHKNVTTELLLDTEQYRIGEIFKLLKSDGKDTVRQQAVRYLLSYSDLLDKDIAREVISIANSMLQDNTVRSTVKVKIASDLKAFLGTAGKKKFVRSTFEELRKEDGILEVEVPD